ncbi:MAG: thioredoxin [bacterium]
MTVEKISDDSFEDKVLKLSDKAALVDFWAEWCGPCKMLAPTLEKTATEMADKAIFYKINTDENPNTAAKYNIASIPCCIIFKDGQEIGRIVGFKPAEALKAEITKILG